MRLDYNNLHNILSYAYIQTLFLLCVLKVPCSSATSKMFLRLLFSKRVMQNRHNDDVIVLKTNSRADVKLKYY